MTPATHDASSIRDVQSTLAAWFTAHARGLPWRFPDVTAWGVLVSEVMLQQTPAARVVEPWTKWMARWPTPAHLAEAATGDVLKQWDRLGYPRRALRLQHAAVAIVSDHGGDVPEDEDSLLALPGVGSYTAAAVLAFAHRRRSLVLDVNVRRVLARLDGGVEHPARHETASERDRAWHWVPKGESDAARWSAAAMELGATVCTARGPRCPECPVAHHCTWVALGRPAWEGPPRVGQTWDGTDRQCRGRIMAALRSATSAVPLADVAWADGAQRLRCAESLIADGLAERTDAGLVLPGTG